MSRIVRGLDKLGRDTVVKTRTFITYDQLDLLRRALPEIIPENARTRKLAWMIYAFLYFGSLRVSEVAAVSYTTVCRDSTLRCKDIQVKFRKDIPGGAYLLITVRGAKHAQGNAIVEILPSGCACCPVEAFRQAFPLGPPHPEEPVAALGQGKFLAGAILNKWLRRVFSPRLPPEEEILCHSLRMAIPTLMGRLGYQPHEIQLQGRWQSAAYLAYCRRGRGLRIADQIKLFKDINSLSSASM